MFVQSVGWLSGAERSRGTTDGPELNGVGASDAGYNQSGDEFVLGC